ncbi:hypothetical protein WN944_021067 [Citrus x changshan-huyou]|uniref:Maf-like protein n=1 Tax=Citrus x changshan-huyou TaxID=2935761 RepID=A0AAP0QZ71_9ROSI
MNTVYAATFRTAHLQTTLESGAEFERKRAMARSESSPIKIILGSSSMARKEILAEMGYEFTVVTAEIDEKSIRKDKPEDLVMALAEAKAEAIRSRLQSAGRLNPTTLLITADTVVNNVKFLNPLGPISCITVLLENLHFSYLVPAAAIAMLVACHVVVYKGSIREKPSSKEEAREFIKGYSGSHAEVVGSVLISNLKTGIRKGGWDRAEVYFHDIPDEVIDNLIEEGITFNVAGGLMLEHPLTLPFVEAVVGATDTVMGLSKALTEKLIWEAQQQ